MAASERASPEHGTAGGPPRFFALHVRPDGALLAGTCGRGISRSSDGGTTWTPIDVRGPSGPQSGKVGPGGPQSGKVGPSGPLSGKLGDSNVFSFAETSTGDVVAATGTGLFRSADGGSTWSPHGLEGTVVYAAAAVGTSLLAGTGGEGVAVSPTWASLDGPGFVYRLVPRPDGRVLAATDGDGVWLVDTDPSEATPSGLAGVTVFSLLEVGDVVLAGTRGDGVHRSDDGGRTWRRVGKGLPDPVVHALVAAPDGTVLAGTGAGVSWSRDRGDTWASLGNELGNHRIFSLAVTADSHVLAGSYEGVWRRALVGGRWEMVDTGLTAGEVFAMSVDDVSGEAFAGTKQGGLRSGDGGATWDRAGPGLDGVSTYHFYAGRGGEALAGTDDGVVAATGSAEGRRWVRAGLDGLRVYVLTAVDDGILAGTLGAGVHRRGADGEWRPSNDGMANPLAFDVLLSRAGDVFAATGVVETGVKSGRIFRSTDGGRSWVPSDHEPITVYRVVETSSGTLFGGAQRSRILRSRDGGSHFDLFHPTALHDTKLYCLAVDGEDRLYLGGGNRLLRSDDEADSWRVIGDGLDGVTVYDLRPHPNGWLLAATSSGLYRSHDRGESWEPARRVDAAAKVGAGAG